MALALLPVGASAATVTVEITADQGSGLIDGNCTLREAIDEAQANGPQAFGPDCDFDLTEPYGDDTITLPAGTYPLVGPSGDNSNDSGDVDLNMGAGNGLTLNGAGSGNTFIDANDNDRVLHVLGTGQFELNGLTLTDGTAPPMESGGGLAILGTNTVTADDLTVTANHAPSQGGGVLVNVVSTATFEDTTISSNSTSISSGNSGAGLASSGVTTISNSTVSANTLTSPDDASNGSGHSGGGLVQTTSGTLTVRDSTISGNTVNSLDPTKFPGGAGIGVTNANLVVRRSLIANNSVTGGGGQAGGGIEFTDDTANNTLTVENSTLTSNSVTAGANSSGGAIWVQKGVTKLANVTMAGNNALQGRGIRYAQALEPSSSFTARGTLIEEDNANECASPTGDVTSAGYNLERGTTCGFNLGTDLQNTDPVLGALTSNGGPTQTRALQSGSPGVNTIPVADCDDTAGAPFTEDQRGAPRPDPAGGTHCDVGAYELTPCNGLGATTIGTGAGETINGTSGADVIAAVGGADTVNAGDGADTVCGGEGADLIRTGTGADSDTARGEGGTDTISFDDLSAGLTTATILDLPNGSATGTDSGADTLNGFENLTGTPHNDPAVGSSPMQGNFAANTIDGGGGNDLIDGRPGDDTLIGGGGTGDTASWNSALTNPVTASLIGGTATSTETGSDTLAGFENLTGTDFADTLTGDNGPNTLNADSGNDILDGRSDADFFVGGPDSDTATFANLPGPVTATLNLGSLTASGQGADTGNTLESLRGSPNDDTLTGDGSANVLSGGDGTDLLNDGSTITIPANADQFEGGAGTDTVSYAARGAGAPVSVNLNGSTDNAGQGTENDDVAADVEGATGGAGDDTLTGDANGNPLTGGGGVDAARFDGVAQAVDASLAAGSATGQGADSLTTLENLVGSTQADQLTGDAAANVLTGGNGADVLDGRELDDQLVGGDGSDTAAFGGIAAPVVVDFATNVASGQATTNDTLTTIESASGSSQDDTFVDAGTSDANGYDGEGGTDLLNYGNAASGVNASLSSGTASGAGTDSLFELESLVGSPSPDTLTGDGADNSLDGLDGGDTITGGAGVDSVFGRGGADSLLLRDSGADSADCGLADAATDTVEADLPQGTDALTNCELDTVAFGNPPQPPPVPTPTPTPKDTCAGKTVTQAAAGSVGVIAGTDGRDVITGTPGPDVIAAKGGNDVVRSLGGNDLICAGPGNDTLAGGAGNDRLLGEAGKDKLRGAAGRDVCKGGGGRDTGSGCEKRGSIP